MLSDQAEGVLVSMGALRSDVLTALRNCSVINSELRGRQWRRTVRGADSDGRDITMIITIAHSQRRIAVVEVVMEPANEH
jgi:hypothetical protein